MKPLRNTCRSSIYMSILLSINLLLCCTKDSYQREIVNVLDIIPFGDRIHFKLFIRKGMEINDITALYGEPKYVFYFDSTGSLLLRNNVNQSIEKVSDRSKSDIYKIQIHSYDSSPFRINNKVYVYLGGFDAIVYVYIDSNERIERVFVGGS